MYIVIARLYYEGKFYGIRVLNPVNNKVRDIVQSDISKYQYSNVTVTSRRYVVAKQGFTADIARVDLPVQYSSLVARGIYKQGLPEFVVHGTGVPLTGRVTPTLSRYANDMGSGFYTGNSPDYSMTFALGSATPMLYTLKPNWSALKVYVFDDDMKWAMCVGVNQTFFKPAPNSRLAHFMHSLSTYDVLVGIVADDRLATVLSNFYEGLIPDSVLSRDLRFVDNGLEFVFRTQKACDALTVIDARVLTNEELHRAQHTKNRKIGQLQTQIAQLQSMYANEGRFVHDILQEWGGIL